MTNPNQYVILCGKCSQHHDRRIACGTLGTMTPRPLTVGKTVAEQRAFRAETIAAGFRSWIPCTTRFAGDAKGGSTVFAIPSQTRLGLFHLATLERCGCHDSTRRSGPCKHRRAIRIVLAQLGLRPDTRLSDRRNGHVIPEEVPAF